MLVTPYPEDRSSFLGDHFSRKSYTGSRSPARTPEKPPGCGPQNPEAPVLQIAQLKAENEGTDGEKESTLLNKFQNTK